MHTHSHTHAAFLSVRIHGCSRRRSPDAETTSSAWTESHALHSPPAPFRGPGRLPPQEPIRCCHVAGAEQTWMRSRRHRERPRQVTPAPRRTPAATRRRGAAFHVQCRSPSRLKDADLPREEPHWLRSLRTPHLPAAPAGRAGAPAPQGESSLRSAHLSRWTGSPGTLLDQSIWRRSQSPGPERLGTHSCTLGSSRPRPSQAWSQGGRASRCAAAQVAHAPRPRFLDPGPSRALTRSRRRPYSRPSEFQA